MKRRERILKGLTYLPILITVISLLFLGDKVPVHFDFDGSVTRWGSKYQLLITPIITIGIGYFFILLAKHIKKKNEGNVERDQKILMIVGITMVLWNNLLSYYFLYRAFIG